MGPRGDRGAAGTLAVLLVLVVAAASVSWTARAGIELREHGRAQAIADLSALSAAAAGPADAAAVAAAVAGDNGAELVSFRWHGATVGVVIRLQGRSASAHAQLGRTTGMPR